MTIKILFLTKSFSRIHAAIHLKNAMNQRMIRLIIILIAASCLMQPVFNTRASGLPSIQTVFIILLENQNWTNIQSNPSAPYINNSLLPVSSHCAQYYNPPGNHPSLPNYLWLEAGTNLGVIDDNNPSYNHQSSTNHLVTLLKNAGLSWKAYEEDISGATVPLDYTNYYAPRHDPFVYFDDVTGTNNSTYPYGIAHIRPYTELAGDLASNTVARYNFITPNVCDDMHDSCAPINNAIRQGDTWLSTEIPKLTNSQAYKNNGAIFIIWDEASSGDGPIGMIALSPLAKGGGYTSTNHYTHSSTLRTVQEIFGVTPLLGDAANTANLSDLFVAPVASPTGFRVTSILKTPGGAPQLSIDGVTPGKTNLLQISTNLADWTTISTNIVSTNTFTFTDTSATNAGLRYYRVVQLP